MSAKPKSGSIPALKRVEYARGFLDLGLIAEAEKELSLVSKEEARRVDVRGLQVDALMAAKKWKRVIALARPLAKEHPLEESAWIAWAFALRELMRVEEAQKVLQTAEPIHGNTSGVLHYNLACYASLLGDLPKARGHLERAMRFDKQWLEAAKEDPDLKALWPELPAKFKR